MSDLELPPRTESVARACDWVEATLQRHGWSPADVTRVVLSVGECVSNAVEHGAPEVPLRLRHEVAGDEATVWVHDGGAGPRPDQVLSAKLPTDPMATGGRGLFILAHLADEVSVDAGGGVQMTFRRGDV